MRAAYVIPSFGLLLVVGIALSFRGRPTDDGGRTSEDVPVAERSTPAPAQRQAESPAAEPPPGLTCIQNALGGTRAIAAVSSLWIVADTKPVATSGMRPLPGTREISVVFPGHYKDVHTGRFPNGRTLSSTTGFDGEVLLSMPRIPGSTTALSSARLRFMREMLMLLPRASTGVTLSQRVMDDGEQERLAIDASGPDSFRGTLLADSRTCVPVAFQYAGTPFSRTAITRTDLSEYHAFGGIQFPTMLQTSLGGISYTEERISRVEVNTPDAARAFAPRG